MTHSPIHQNVPCEDTIFLLQYVEDKEYPCGEIKEEKGIQVKIHNILLCRIWISVSWWLTQAHKNYFGLFFLNEEKKLIWEH